jgi:molecular chaperone DnaJ
LNPGDKSSEDRFKTVQEAYDILSDAKKRQMYDQFGFYSDSGFPGAGATLPAVRARPPPTRMDFSGFDFSDFFQGGAGGGSGAEGRAGGGRRETGGGFRDVFSQFFTRGGGAPQPSPKRAAISNTFWISISGRRFAGLRPV